MKRLFFTFLFLFMHMVLSSQDSVSSRVEITPEVAKMGSEVTAIEHIQFPSGYVPNLDSFFRNMFDFGTYKIIGTSYDLKTNSLDIVFKITPESYGTINFCPGICPFIREDTNVLLTVLLNSGTFTCIPTVTSGLEFSNPVPFNFDSLVLIDSENRKASYENQVKHQKDLQDNERILERRKTFFSAVYFFFFGLFLAVIVLWVVYQFDIPLYPKPKKLIPKDARALFEVLVKNKDLPFSKKEDISAKAIRLSLQELLLSPASSLTLDELRGLVQENATIGLDDKTFLFQAFKTLEEIQFTKSQEKENALSLLTESFYSWFTKTKLTEPQHRS